MDIKEKVIQEWFFRLPKGYAEPPYSSEEMRIFREVLSEHINESPDILDQGFLDATPVEKDIEENDTASENEMFYEYISDDVLTEDYDKVSKDDIVKLIKNTDLDSEDLFKINQIINSVAFKSSVIQYFEKKNITSGNYQIGQDAVNIIFNKIAKLPDAKEVIEYFESPKDLKWDSAGKGDITKLTGLNDKTISNLIKIQPGADAGGSATGPAEIALILLFDNVFNSTSGGDIVVDGQTTELKGKGGRLGQQAGRGKELNIKNNFLSNMLSVDEEAKEEFLNNPDNRNIAYAIKNAYELLVDNDVISKADFIDNVQDGIGNIFFNKDSVARKYFDASLNYNDVVDVGRALAKTNLESYMDKINVDTIIFHEHRPPKYMSTSFIVVTRDDIDDVVDAGSITLGSKKPESSFMWHNTNPGVALN
jgi:hypothetical protein